MKKSLTHIGFMVDSCAFHPPVPDQKKAMEELWKFDEQELIILEIAEATDEEIQRAPTKIHKLANSRICSRDMANTPREQQAIKEISNVLFPNKNKLTDGNEKDVRNIFVAIKYEFDYFVTYDKKHILSKFDIIREKFKLTVLTPIQCLEVVLNKLKD